MEIPKMSVLQETKEKYPKDGITCHTYRGHSPPPDFNYIENMSPTTILET